MNGKGDKQRPSQVSADQFDENWEKVFGTQDNFDVSKVDVTQAYDYGAPTRDGSHIDRENFSPEVREAFNDLWSPSPKKGEMLREVVGDGMWQHSCTVEMSVMWIGKDETCSLCGAWEEDGQ